MNIKNRSRRERVGSIAQLLAGFNKHCLKMGGIVVDAETLKPKDVTSGLQEVVDSATRVAEARGSLRAALEAEQRISDEQAALVNAVRSFALSAFASRADVLADFGLVKRDRKQRTVQEKLETVAKLLATREARHTMGRRQKQRIHGTPPVAKLATPPANVPTNAPAYAPANAPAYAPGYAPTNAPAYSPPYAPANPPAYVPASTPDTPPVPIKPAQTSAPSAPSTGASPPAGPEPPPIAPAAAPVTNGAKVVSGTATNGGSG